MKRYTKATIDCPRCDDGAVEVEYYYLPATRLDPSEADINTVKATCQCCDASQKELWDALNAHGAEYDR